MVEQIIKYEAAISHVTGLSIREKDNLYAFLALVPHSLLQEVYCEILISE